MSAAREIVALCAVAKRPDEAAPAIRANTPVETVRASLIQALADADEHTDGTRPRQNEPVKNTSTEPNPQAVWAAHRKQQPKKGR